MVFGFLDQEKLNRCKVSPQVALAFQNKIKNDENIASGVGH